MMYNAQYALNKMIFETRGPVCQEENIQKFNKILSLTSYVCYVNIPKLVHGQASNAFT